MANVNLRRLLLVVAGGTIGTAARLALGLLIPAGTGLPLAVFVANVVGALLMGIVAARLPAGRDARLLLGTGLLGGFTTYSAYMTGTIALWGDAPLLAIAYALGSLVLGLAAVLVGVRLGRTRRSSSGAA